MILLKLYWDVEDSDSKQVCCADRKLRTETTKTPSTWALTFSRECPERLDSTRGQMVLRAKMVSPVGRAHRVEMVCLDPPDSPEIPDSPDGMELTDPRA